MSEEIIETTTLTNRPLIKKDNLDKNQYTFSLLKAGFSRGILSKDIIENIQMQIMNILKEIIMRYTKGESTSVTVETAEKLLNSICYSIDAYSISIDNPEECIAILKEKSIKEIYNGGIEIVTACVKESKLLYKKIMPRKLKVPLMAYNDTLEAILGLFDKYEIVFNAQDKIATIDYPLAFDDMNAKGIFYIKQYLETLELENEFCNLFDIEDITKTLNDYGKIYEIDYTQALINIFEVIINNSIFSAILGNSAKTLNITKFQYNVLNNKLKSLETHKISSFINEGIEKMIIDLQINVSKLIEYIYKYKTLFLQRILNALENDSLNNLVVIDKEEELNINEILFEAGERIDDCSFRSLTNKIAKCRNGMEKIHLIKTNIHSVQDFIDILGADCLFDDEFGLLFNTLSDMELCVLGKVVFCEELRSGLLNLSSINLGNKDSEWQIQYISFIQSLGKERIKEIEKLIKFN